MGGVVYLIIFVTNVNELQGLYNSNNIDKVSKSLQENNIETFQETFYLSESMILNGELSFGS